MVLVPVGAPWLGYGLIGYQTLGFSALSSVGSRTVVPGCLPDGVSDPGVSAWCSGDLRVPLQPLGVRGALATSCWSLTG